jgi:beta-lactamase class A
MDSPTRTRQGPRVGGPRSDEVVPVAPDPEFERFERSLRGSRERRAARPRRRGWSWHHAAPLGGALAAWWLLVAAPELDGGAPAPRGEGRSVSSAPAVSAPRSTVIPADDAVDEAWSYARERGGFVSLAVIDSDGRMHSFEGERAYVSASVVKALLLAAELNRLEAAGLPLDDGTRTLLTQMIAVSDNDAADAIYSRVGDAGLYDVARRAGMESFRVAGYWSNAQITAEDMARFMWRLDHVLAGPHREFGLRLLGGITASQRWGIPQGAGPEWEVRFKGGWRSTDMGELVHQAAELRSADERVAMAILTDAQPSQPYAFETLRGVADRLVGPLSRASWEGRWRT